MRLRRTWIAAIMALGLLFAQIVTAAHACSTLALPPAHESSAMPADCAQSSVRIDSTINICVSHCDSGAQVDSHAVRAAQLAGGELVADEQLVSDRLHFLGIQQHRAAVPFLEFEKPRRLGIDI